MRRLCAGSVLVLAAPALASSASRALEQVDRLANWMKAGEYRQCQMELERTLSTLKSGPSRDRLALMAELSHLLTYYLYDHEAAERLDKSILSGMASPIAEPSRYTDLPYSASGYVLINRTHLDRWRNISMSAIGEGAHKRRADRELFTRDNLLFSADANLDSTEVAKDLEAFGRAGTDNRTRIELGFRLLPTLYAQKRREDAKALGTFLIELNSQDPALFGQVSRDAWTRLYYIYANLALESGENAVGLRYLDRCIAALNEARESIQDELQRTRYFTNIDLLMERRVALLSDLGRVPEAMLAVEFKKGNTLKEMVFGKKITTQVESREASALPAMAVDRAIRGLALRPTSNLKPGANLGSGQSRKSEWTPFPAAKQLDPSGTSLLVQYYYDAKGLYTYLIHPRLGVREIRQAVDRAQLQNLIEAHVSRMSTGADPGSLKAMDQSLWNLLISPLLDLPDLSSLNMVVFPYGKLNQLPFQTLGLSREAPLLTQVRSLSSYPSLELYAHAEPGISGQPSLLTLGVNTFQGLPPLAFAVPEAQAIARLLPGATCLVNGHATRAELLKAIPLHNMLHIATHAIYDENDPLRSRIYLENGETLQAHEVRSLDLKGKLVVLSACETGIQKISVGDELFGFDRYLLAAGANGIITTLWSIDDRATAEFMLSFYRTLTAKHALKEAFAAALISTREKFPHPTYWGAFKLTCR